MRHSSSRRNRGFTLIEVLLVLVILVVLASLAVVAYGPIQRKANINSAKTQAELLAQAVDSYQLAIGTYPSSQSGLQALRSAPGDLAGSVQVGRPVPSKRHSFGPVEPAVSIRLPRLTQPEQF